MFKLTIHRIKDGMARMIRIASNTFQFDLTNFLNPESCILAISSKIKRIVIILSVWARMDMFFSGSLNPWRNIITALIRISAKMNWSLSSSPLILRIYLALE
jgi:hypothetical protein